MAPNSTSWSAGFSTPASWRNDEFLEKSFDRGLGFNLAGGLGLEPQVITGSIGAGIMAAGKMLLAAHPLAGAITIAVGALTQLIGGLFKPDITKIETTHIVDQIEAQVLKPLRAEWQALPASAKTFEAQAAYLKIFDGAWSAVLQGCGKSVYGSAGQNCINDRAAGSCHWTIDGQTPGVPPDCGNWFVWYRNVAANDPEVHAAGDTAGQVDAGGGAGSGGGGGIFPPQTTGTVDGGGGSKALLWLGAAFLAGFVFTWVAE
jgi:hypothetical protein